MNLTKSQDARIPVRLINASGSPVTGVVPGDVLSGKATVVKADGTTADITLSAGVNWFEIHTTKAPGLYHVKILAADLGVNGPTQVSVMPAASVFVGSIITATVGSNHVWDEPRRSSTTVVSGSFGEMFRVLRQLISGRVKVNETAGIKTVYSEDNTTTLQQQTLQDASGNLAGLGAVEVLAAP